MMPYKLCVVGGNVTLTPRRISKTVALKLLAILISEVTKKSILHGVCPLFLSGRTSRVGAWVNWNKLMGPSSNGRLRRISPPKLRPITRARGRIPSPNFTRRHRLKTKPRWNLPVWTGFNRLWLWVSCLREERRRRHTTSIPPRWKIIRVTN